MIEKYASKWTTLGPSIKATSHTDFQSQQALEILNIKEDYLSHIESTNPPESSSNLTNSQSRNMKITKTATPKSEKKLKLNYSENLKSNRVVRYEDEKKENNSDEIMQVSDEDDDKLKSLYQNEIFNSDFELGDSEFDCDQKSEISEDFPLSEPVIKKVKIL